MEGTAVVSSLIEELTSMVSEYLLEEVSLISNFREDFDTLSDELECIRSLLKDAGGKKNSTSVCNWVEKLEDFLGDAVDIVEECQEVGNFCNPFFRRKMGRKIKKLNERITKIKVSAKYIENVGSLLDVNARIESSSQVKKEISNASVHPVGMKNDIEDITELILKEDGPRVIAVVGMGGQGKTLLAQSVFNQQSVKQHFDHQFWLVVSQKLDVNNVLKQMGRPMKRKDITNIESFADLEGKRCLFVFDDVWDRDALVELLERTVLRIKIKVKIVITTRHRNVAEDLGDPPHIHKMKNLSEKDSLELFCVHAFPERSDHSFPEALKNVNFHLEKCGGLPLAIKTIGASMARVKRHPNDWEQRLIRLNNLDAVSERVMPSLRLSYEVLRDDLKACFLYFSVFPKSIEIDCENLVHMWIAQGLVSSQVGAGEDAYDAGRWYIEELIDRCLIEVSQVGGDERVERCKIHDLLHDLVVSESLKLTKCLLNPPKQLQKLPVKDCRAMRRISLIKYDISTIKEPIHCPGLRTLLLSENFFLTSISASFFNNLTHLRVLDLSQTAISSVPKSVRKLKHLKFLNLSRTNISMLPEFLSGLRRLQFLDVSHCSKLAKLHSGIGEHKFMLYLNVKSCEALQCLPVGISKLHHLQTLKLEGTLSDAIAFQLRDLKELTLLQNLSLHVNYKAVPSAVAEEGTIQLEEGTFGGMKKMRTLSFININTSPSPLLSLPEDMEAMERLETVRLRKCVVPKWIFGLRNLMELELQYDNSMGNAYKGLESIANLKKLHLSQNDNRIEFPTEFGESKAFPKLEELIIDRFRHLEKFPQLQDTAMPMLKYFRLRWCDELKDIAEGLGRLRSLQEVEVLRSAGDRDLWKGQWRQILKGRHIQLRVSPEDQIAIDEIDIRDIAIQEN